MIYNFLTNLTETTKNLSLFFSILHLCIKLSPRVGRGYANKTFLPFHYKLALAGVNRGTPGLIPPTTENIFILLE